MAIICHKWIEHLVYPSSVQEDPTEIATLTEATEDIKETRVYKHDSATFTAFSTRAMIFLAIRSQKIFINSPLEFVPAFQERHKFLNQKWKTFKYFSDNS